ncbi:phage tail protein [Rhizobium sp. VS19-DR104.2]|uniref:phage tail tube protein n=1 Tax=unclassified Rhizobium TaxID=2613769 RepID=UPI001CC63F22|nr:MULTISPECIES: phage tail tube protein [unclassified Rhizobium]MBZ5760279.1 phage tail protein [Rhizobium sp. VS19-DR96]MBZ5766877.1 phage tail protein [Rhizobium sp. VS19-DR129.2]MBZ5773130.1 phage tail protein [Rhizobium sp. VS19-DRK62.2]MBZ5784114.1 phage tail protein [Rhizobium sp. VS19-DR121]MBZ5802474.1 phage tail protein [Rhizobium sp. VS19-DR181]
MAKPTTARFGKFRILLGNSASPVVYSAPCGFTSKSLTLSKDLTDVTLPDCDDPDAVAWVGRDASSLSASVTGEGVLAAESVEVWLDAYEDVESVPVKIEIEFPAKTITWTGAMHISSLNPSSEQGGRVTMSVEMQSDGELTRTTTPNA